MNLHLNQLFHTKGRLVACAHELQRGIFGPLPYSTCNLHISNFLKWHLSHFAISLCRWPALS